MNKIEITVKYSDKEKQVLAQIVKVMEPGLKHFIQTLVFSYETDSVVDWGYIKKVKAGCKKGFEKEEGWIVHEVLVTH